MSLYFCHDRSIYKTDWDCFLQRLQRTYGLEGLAPSKVTEHDFRWECLKTLPDFTLLR